MNIKATQLKCFAQVKVSTILLISYFYLLLGGLRNCTCAFITCRRAASGTGTFLSPILTFVSCFFFFPTKQRLYRQRTGVCLRVRCRMNAPWTRFSAEAEAPPVGRGLHMRHWGRKERFFHIKHSDGIYRLAWNKNIIWRKKKKSAQQSTARRRKLKTKTGSFFSYQTNCPKDAAKSFQKLLNVSPTQKAWNHLKQRVLPVCLRVLDSRSQRPILAPLAFWLCSLESAFFFLWKKRLLQTSCNERGKKGKTGLNRKWWRSCMEIILETKLETENQWRPVHWFKLRVKSC